MSNNYYFSHDYNARNDPKLQEVMMEMGMEGVGLYWCLVELMFEQDGKLLIEKCQRYAFTLRTDEAKIKKLIELVFESDDECFWSNGVLKRLAARFEKSEKARKSVQARWNKQNTSGDDTSVLPALYEGFTTKERKGKENKTKKNPPTPFSNPTAVNNGQPNIKPTKPTTTSSFQASPTKVQDAEPKLSKETIEKLWNYADGGFSRGNK